ncbi:MAG: ribosome small subunit-dependent GTPase A [Spirochaetales bacterium]|nr:ribosome small subunit-dependent GTPase A [Spirochaetales bacterium]
MKGLVLFGINNIYTVLSDGKQYQCRIKGKILNEEIQHYNPISVGDYVEIDKDPHSDDVGWITGRVDRKNSIIRYNRKRRAPQVIAANVDLLVCVASIKSPPFRPRFLDRLIIAGEISRVPVLIVINKRDLGFDENDQKRIAYYGKIGYDILLTSAADGTGMNDLNNRLEGKIAVLTGHSGVGKTSLLNCLEPGLQLKVGEISSKYNRGVHTTRYSVMINRDIGGWIIDTPGIRELEIFDMEPDQLRFYYPDFMQYSEKCEYTSCLHMEEPDCAVREAVSRNEIHPDRYQSYRNLMDELKEAQTLNYG